MRNILSYSLAGALVVVLLDVVAPPAGLGAAWSTFEGGAASQVVDRAHKSDRLHVPRASGRQMTPRSAPVLVGCEPVFSALSKEKHANFPGRCLV
jgi:hypothetical protein